MFTYKASLPLSGLAIPLFALFGSVLFELSLQLTALINLSLSLGISLVLPTIAIALSVVAVLTAQFTIALGLSLPSFTLNFALAISFELVLVLGFLATLNALIDALINASLLAYGWFGSAVDMASALGSTGNAWPDGTSPDTDIKAVLFVATSSGSFGKDQIESISLMPTPSPPPTPQHPPPPAGAYPPPQAYEHGLVNLVIAPPASGTPAAGTVTVDNSVRTGIGKITGYTITNHGSGYTSMPSVQISDTVQIAAIAAGSPVVLTLPNALTIPVGQGFGCSIAGDANDFNGQANAKVLTATTVALYKDSAFTDPISGSGTSGTITGGGTGAAALVTMGGGAVNALQSFLDGLEWPTSTGLAGGVITFRAMLATVFGLMLDLQGNLQARANLLGSIKIGLDVIPPSISASLELLAKISANLKANLSVKLPDLTVSLAASLSAQIDAVAKLVFRIGFLLGLASVDLEIWEYNGPGSGLGAAVANGPGATGWHDHTGPSTPVVAAVFGLTNPASAAAFSALFPGA